MWFYHNKKKVAGIELSEIACKEFFIENQISYNIINYNDFIVYVSIDKKIIIINGDFFQLNKKLFEYFKIHIDGIYDRASLIALPSDLRKKYVEKIFELFDDKIKYFLITMEYEPLENSDKEIGPPFSVSEKEIKILFQDKFKLNKITEKPIERNNVKKCKEVLYFLEK